jgi:2-hydroxychromene-2-carboxylate isomerase
VSSPAAAFYFDLASPLAYLAAERVLHELPAAAEWRPVLARGLPGAQSSTAATRAELETFHAELLEQRHELELQPLRWPDPFPFDSAMAMRVATFARSIGRTVPFAQAAFRQAFAGGRSLEDPDSVLIAAAACEMHPAAVLRAARLRSVAAALAEETARAGAAGVRDVPAITLGERVFQGARAVEEAAAEMRLKDGGARLR